MNQLLNSISLPEFHSLTECLQSLNSIRKWNCGFRLIQSKQPSAINNQYFIIRIRSFIFHSCSIYFPPNPAPAPFHFIPFQFILSRLVCFICFQSLFILKPNSQFACASFFHCGLNSLAAKTTIAEVFNWSFILPPAEKEREINEISKLNWISIWIDWNEN